MVRYTKHQGARLSRRILNGRFGKPAVKRTDEQCWELEHYVRNTMCGNSWDLHGPLELAMFNQEFQCGTMWRSWWEERPDAESWVVIEKQNNVPMWCWFRNFRKSSEWTPVA